MLWFAVDVVFGFDLVTSVALRSALEVVVLAAGAHPPAIRELLRTEEVALRFVILVGPPPISFLFLLLLVLGRVERHRAASKLRFLVDRRSFRLLVVRVHQLVQIFRNQRHELGFVKTGVQVARRVLGREPLVLARRLLGVFDCQTLTRRRLRQAAHDGNVLFGRWWPAARLAQRQAVS